jgi:hypothetical protein
MEWYSYLPYIICLIGFLVAVHSLILEPEIRLDYSEKIQNEYTAAISHAKTRYLIFERNIIFQTAIIISCRRKICHKKGIMLTE